MRTFVNNATEQVPTDSLARSRSRTSSRRFSRAASSSASASPSRPGASTTRDSWIPDTFNGEGYGLLYDVNLKPKTAYYALQQDLALSAGTVHRGGVGAEAGK